MVNVKLVENSVKRKVGIVIVVKVITQYRIPGITLMKNLIIFPKTPNVDPATAASVWVVGIPVTDAMAEAIVESMELTELPTREETVSEAMIPD